MGCEILQGGGVIPFLNLTRRKCRGAACNTKPKETVFPPAICIVLWLAVGIAFWALIFVALFL